MINQSYKYKINKIIKEYGINKKISIKIKKGLLLINKKLISIIQIIIKIIIRITLIITIKTIVLQFNN